MLIVKLGAIGDIIHTLPAVAAIRGHLPDARISWVAETRSAEILRGNGLIDELIEVDTRALREGSVIDDILPAIRSQLTGLRSKKFDVAVDFQGLLKSALIAKLSGARLRGGFSRKSMREPAGRIFLTNVAKVQPQTHVIEKNLLLASAAFGFPAKPERLEFPITAGAEHAAEAEKIIAESGQNFAILNPGGGWVTKLWPAENYGQLADKIYEETGIVSVVATGPAETELAVKVRQNSKIGKLIVTQPSLKGFYELAKKAKVYVGGDTGPTHLAIAARTPIVGIFGPTEWWRNGSLNPDDICIGRNDIGCRVDCHRRTCTNWICMDISVECIFQAVNQRLQQ
ncbi:MAG: lipopolysaccharide heptosyltransferase I [Blastocatellia bacterium]